MRLIDADKLEDAIIWDEMPSSLYGLNDTNLDIIYNQEEVEAIPIEWLKKWAKDNSNGEWSVEYRTVFNGILKDWEKENE